MTVRRRLAHIPVPALLAAMLASPALAQLALPDVPLVFNYRADPNVLIDLSVEQPMGGAAYADHDDRGLGGTCTGRLVESGASIGVCYVPGATYLGYFDPAKCYAHPGGDGVFRPAGSASADHSCTGRGWSGNFLNWATMTAIDEFRWAMTGGNRVVDTAAETVLQRARAVDNGEWFPVKKLSAAHNVAPNTVTPFAAGQIYIQSHTENTAVRIGTSRGGAELGTFAVRVRVCDAAAGVEANCAFHANGTSWKPRGLIQHNAERMRFALASYLNNQDATRDGGVLRSKMKYTGLRRYASGSMSANPNSEWNELDGTLAANPDPAEAAASGVAGSGIINYINRFGENGYKLFDPAAELFYEALRYFKNLGRTPEYAAGATAAEKDGFPVILNWDDPIQFRCQRNFIIGINDANPWFDKKLPGTAFLGPTMIGAGGLEVSLAQNSDGVTSNDFGEPSNADRAINVRLWTNAVGALEGLNGTTWASEAGVWRSGTASGVTDGVGGGVGNFTNECATPKVVTGLGEVMGSCPYPPKQNSYYIAGLAYYANTQDLRPDLPGKQSVGTFMIDTQEYSTSPLDGPRNMLWLTGKYGGFRDRQGNAARDFLATPLRADEWDADGDGVPDNYVFANRPEKLVSGLARAFDDVARRIASTASAAASGMSLRAGNSIYQVRFDTRDWSGQVLAYPVDANGGVATAAAWDAGARINAQTGASSDSRNILTLGAGDGVAFRWADLTAARRADLQRNPVSGQQDGEATGQARLGHLRGHSGHEGLTAVPRLRERPGSRLGDIVNSNPWYVGAAAAGYSDVDEPGYAAFAQARADRRPVLWVGANDGMLHGINACEAGRGYDGGAYACIAEDQGRELLAYVPDALFPSLARLTDPGYTHRFYVDGSPFVADARVGGQWMSVLAGGFNAGGRGWYALNVSDPARFAEANAAELVLWEFTSAHDADLGYTYNQPAASRATGQARQIAKLRVNGADKWAVIVGNGYNSPSNRAALYLLFIEDGIDGVWTPDQDFRKLVVECNPACPGANGLSTPTPMDTNGDGIVDAVYAGDLQGNLWKFLVGPQDADVTVTDNPDTWKADFNGQPLFVARDGAGNRQPIVAAPEVTLHPRQGQVVLVGTGRFLENTDIGSQAAQSFYGVLDAADGLTRVGSRSDLFARTLGEGGASGTTADGSGAAQAGQRTVSGGEFSYRLPGTQDQTYLGWVVDLPAGGERVVANPQIIAGTVFFNTLIPTTDACGVGGSGWLMALDYLGGGEAPVATFDANGDGSIDAADARLAGVLLSYPFDGGTGLALGGTTIVRGEAGSRGVGISSLSNIAATDGDASALLSTLLRFAPGYRGRITWREIVQ
ncbi:MAG: hypothetical protein HY778_06215 [Betaproteobacteria bacterium]|nr:hypothetical protein [Betaproteobacteria bacterium]